MPLLNFRDPACAADPEGSLVRRGILFRSAQPHPGAGTPAVRELESHGIRVVIDLRSPEERGNEWAAAEAAGVTVVTAPVAPDAGDAGDAIIGPGIAALHTSADLGRFYADLAASAPGAVATAVRAVAGPGPALVHCAAGKDRTGLLTALFLELAGVPDEGIADDYVRTAEALPEILAALADRHQTALNTLPEDLGGKPADPRAALRDAAPAPLLQAPREAIEVFLRTVRSRYGGAEGFLLGCGVEAAVIEAFRAKAALSSPVAAG
ncbi:tyrosine-protein phosphatase [Streptomyces bacillaris]|uniref:tyrosine-protein phosphatase n=1 Tax=Streptomyces bacillaris TaxID=68179 RepID=UPI00346124DD